MTEEKRKRLAGAITFATILLIVILVSIVISQLVIMTSLKKRKQQLVKDIQYYEEQTKNGQQTLEDLQSLWYLQEKLVENGYHY